MLKIDLKFHFGTTYYFSEYFLYFLESCRPCTCVHENNCSQPFYGRVINTFGGDPSHRSSSL